MAKVPRRALRAALQHCSGDDSGTDPGGHLNEHQIGGVRPVAAQLAEGHDVDVVVHEYRHVEAALHQPWHVETVPTGHDRRVDGAARLVFHGPGQPDADCCELGSAPLGLKQQGADRFDQPAQHRLRPIRDGQ